MNVRSAMTPSMLLSRPERKGRFTIRIGVPWIRMIRLKNLSSKNRSEKDSHSTAANP